MIVELPYEILDFMVHEATVVIFWKEGTEDCVRLLKYGVPPRIDSKDLDLRLVGSKV